MSTPRVLRVVLLAIFAQCFFVFVPTHSNNRNGIHPDGGDPPMEMKTQLGLNFEAFIHALSEKFFENAIDYMPLCAFDDISQQDMLLKLRQSDSLLPVSSLGSRIINNEYYEGRSNWYARLDAELMRVIAAPKGMKSPDGQALRSKLAGLYGEMNVHPLDKEKAFRVKQRTSYYAIHENGMWKFVETSLSGECLPADVKEVLEK